jgi:DNA invertase Pin-like site-specific DNA recombinase
MSDREDKLGKGNRTATIIRVSDESQVDGHSLEAQRLGIERWCQQRGYVLMREYTEPGVSAHKDEIEKRPELLRLLQDAERGEFDIVVVHTLDRLARKLSIQMQVLTRLARAGVGFASVNDPFDYSTPQGRLMLNQMGAYNEFFSDLLGIHVSKAFRLIVESGLTVGPVPFGYQRQERGLPPLKVEQEAEAVKEGFLRRDEGQSYGQIAAWLNTQGFRTREGHAFTAHAVRDLLENHFYCGYIKYKDKEFPGKHEAIISEELFQRVQARRHRREVVRSVHGPKGLLQGIIACAHCGNHLHSDRHRQRVPLYRERHAHECPTNNTSIMAEVIDKQVATIIHCLDLHPDWKGKMAELAVANYDGPNPEELRQKRRRIVRAYGDGGYTDEEYKVRLAEIDRQIEQTSVVTSPLIEDAVALFEDIPMLWNEATPEERRRLLTPLIELVYVDLKAKRVTAIKPTPAFRALFGNGIEVPTNAPISLFAQGEQFNDIGGDGGDGGGARIDDSKLLMGSKHSASIDITSYHSSKNPDLPLDCLLVVGRVPWL